MLLISELQLADMDPSLELPVITAPHLTVLPLTVQAELVQWLWAVSLESGNMIGIFALPSLAK